jgi:hypothetical protein
MFVFLFIGILAVVAVFARMAGRWFGRRAVAKASSRAISTSTPPLPPTAAPVTIASALETIQQDELVALLKDSSYGGRLKGLYQPPALQPTLFGTEHTTTVYEPKVVGVSKAELSKFLLNDWTTTEAGRTARPLEIGDGTELAETIAAYGEQLRRGER